MATNGLPRITQWDKKSMTKLSLTLAIALLSLPVAIAAAADTIAVENPWIRSAPPTSKVMAGYLVIHNHGTEPVTLTGAASESFRQVEIHRTMIMNGMAHMTPVTTLDIDGHGRATFEPNGYHLMLIDPQRHFTPGDRVPLVLEFADGEQVRFDAKVSEGADDHDSHHHHHH